MYIFLRIFLLAIIGVGIAGGASLLLSMVRDIKNGADFRRYRELGVSCMADSPEVGYDGGHYTLFMKYEIEGKRYTGALDTRFCKSITELEEIAERGDCIFVRVDPNDLHRFCFYRDMDETKGIAALCITGKAVFGALIAAGTLGLMKVAVSVYLIERFLSWL
ncbi:MAG: hypothetical protein IJ071_03595 [Ruminococcus sp.]|nr:hypothetical protein [Ruminococcus sp.]